MHKKKEKKICRKEDPFISCRFISTQYGSKLHNEWVRKKKNNHIIIFNITKK